MKTKTNSYFVIIKSIIILLTITGILAVNGCGKKESTLNMSEDAAGKVYIPPGKYDEFYSFLSGGFSGQLAVYGLPSGRLFRVIPVFSVDPEKGWGYTEETKPMLMTSHGFLPWGDAHHPELSMKEGVPDGRWVFINENNTPRIARIDLKTFRTAEIIEIPNSAGNHSSPFTTENSEYVIAGTRFSIPIREKDVSINSYSENFNGTVSFIKVNPSNGRMSIAFQIMSPPFDYDLSHAGKGPSHDWMFFSCYNTEQAFSLLEVNASQKDKDFIMAVNWKKAEDYVTQGKAKDYEADYYHNVYDDATHSASSEKLTSVKVLDPSECPGMVYYIPCPKSPHGADVDPSGEYIVGGGKLSTVIPVFSFSKMLKAIDGKQFDSEINSIPVLKYDAVIAGEVQNPGLGPLHTEFDGNGYAYTSMFVSSEVVKWKLGSWEVVDRAPSFYSVGHIMIPGGDCKKPWGKYLLVLNKITKDRFLPTGPELTQSCQLYDITGEKMKLLLDFPTIGEPHYAQAITADLISGNSLKIFKINENNHVHATRSSNDVKVERKGNEVHIYMTMIRSHFTPDNIEGIKLSDKVFFHVTNLEQDWDIPHGFAVMGNNTSEMLIMPGETQTITWEPKQVGVFPFYCTDFCSALHQEMQGYIRVHKKEASVELTFSTGTK
ncbi:MAG: Sec-dependent nitrous-oxide reductase [Chlorobi bacterium]|nr:Sec-dependent nitrous-oxide reductase [Chlorobiota bacterium]MCI0716416.1 Sec-dependent nitrous-oxide reductase [Chlorobiota bacterium]